MTRRAGTLKDWHKARKYSGVIRDGEVIEWTCDHSHTTSREALACANEQFQAAAK